MLILVISILGSNLKFFLNELIEFSGYFTGDRFYETESTFYKSIAFISQKIQHNNIGFFVKQKLKALCGCKKNETRLNYKLAIKSKLSTEYKISGNWHNSFEFLNQLILYHLDGIKFSKSWVINSLDYKNFICSSKELYNGNLFSLNGPEKSFISLTARFGSNPKIENIKMYSGILVELYYILAYYPPIKEPEFQVYSNELQNGLYKKKSFDNIEIKIFSKKSPPRMNNLWLIIGMGFSTKSTPSRFFFWYRLIQTKVFQMIKNVFLKRSIFSQAEKFFFCAIAKILNLS